MLGINTESTLKQHLTDSLNFYRDLFEDEEKDEKEMKKKHQLIEQIDFTSEEKCIEFLNNLEADGGGDPPEAVLDGM